MRILTRIGSRAVYLVLVLLGASFLVYLLLELLPGDPAEILVSTTGNVTEGAVEEIRTELGLDKPLLVRYVEWIGGVVTGDFGTSFRTGQPVLSEITARLPVTLQLVLVAELISLAIAVPLAVAAARRRDTAFDRGVNAVMFGLQSTPNFVVALVLIVVLSVNLKLLPAIGFVPLEEDLWGNFRSILIPSLALSAALVPLYTRVLRTEMIRTLQEDFILVARAGGLRPRTVLFRYALRPSLPTLVTVVGINIGTLIGGTLIVELISGLPGIGTLLYSGINNRDYILVQGIVLFIAAAYVILNFFVDLLYTAIDPRVRA